MPHPLRLASLIFICAAVYLIGNGSVPLWDRDEPRNAQAARQMLESGDWVVPRFLDKVRTAKPVLTYWCQAAAMRLLANDAFAARLPSVIATTLMLIVLGVVLRRHVDHERAFWTVFVLASSGIVIGWSARNSLTDAVLVLCITIAQLCLFAALNGNASWLVVIVMSVAIGLAGLTKGPVVLGVMGMTVIGWLVLQRFGGTNEIGGGKKILGHGLAARVTVGIAIVVMIVAPWAYLVEKRAAGFLYASTSHEVARRIFEPLEQHGGPPGYYLLVLWGIYFPWSVLLPMTFVVAFRHLREDPLVRFALAAVIGPWVMFELVRTKLPHYMLPAFPALAFLTADGIVRCLRREHPDLLARGTRVAVGVWAAIVVGLACAPLALMSRVEGLPVGASIAVAVIGVVYPIVTFVFFLRQRLRAALLTMGGGMIVVIGVLWGIYLPRVPQLRLSKCVAQTLRAHGGGAEATQAGGVQMIGYKEPSLAFYQGGTIRVQGDNDFLIKHPPAEWPTFLTIREDVWQRMPEDVKGNLQVLGTCRGWAYADKGRMWTVVIVRSRHAVGM